MNTESCEKCGIVIDLDNVKFNPNDPYSGARHSWDCPVCKHDNVRFKE